MVEFWQTSGPTIIEEQDLRAQELHVLIASGEPVIDSTIIDLMSQDYSVNAVTHCVGYEIATLVEQHPFDLFILVVNNVISPLPDAGERGLQVLQLITHLKKTYGKPVVALSGAPGVSVFSEQRVKQAGADLYLTMPFDCEDFMTAIRNML